MATAVTSGARGGLRARRYVRFDAVDLEVRGRPGPRDRCGPRRGCGPSSRRSAP
ncbi:MAG: hypothetical protein MZV64_10905 [Ignavibacteriales bacterium]|nr:hypothetical protein [Ignavibacteriales bacterium]